VCAKARKALMKTKKKMKPNSRSKNALPYFVEKRRKNIPSED
jgi:hypothetical protein